MIFSVCHAIKNILAEQQAFPIFSIQHDPFNGFRAIFQVVVLFIAAEQECVACSTKAGVIHPNSGTYRIVSLIGFGPAFSAKWVYKKYFSAFFYNGFSSPPFARTVFFTGKGSLCNRIFRGNTCSCAAGRKIRFQIIQAQYKSFVFCACLS